MDDGGPAFPLTEDAVSHKNRDLAMQGMSLRDYFAAQAEQPGMVEICAAAGFSYRSGSVWQDEDTSLGPFEKWWGDMAQEKRFFLASVIKYQQADAMLAARTPIREGAK